MANEEHLAILEQGVETWNEWRENNPVVKPDLKAAYLLGVSLDYVNLSGVDLSEAVLSLAGLHETNLSRADLYNANLSETDLRSTNLSYTRLCRANLSNANLYRANLIEADLREANLSNTDIRYAKLTQAKLNGARLIEANLSYADLSRTDLRDVNLRMSILIRTNLSYANLSGCKIYGISIWDANLEGATQQDLEITDWTFPEDGEAIITVDNIEIAQFIHMLVNNKKVRDVIDTITSKAVLILGRFTEDRKPILDAIREELRKRNYIPILFDFEKPDSRNLTETIVTLAHLARFIIADLTDARSLPQELQAIVPNLPSVAVRPIILRGQQPYAMFEHFRHYHWLLPTHEYESEETLLAELVDKIITPAEEKVKQLRTGGAG